MSRKLLSIAALLVGALPALAPPATAIYGGAVASGPSLGFVAEVLNPSANGLCSGSLVHPSWVLTAAHCSVPFSVGDMIVRVGNTVARTGGEMRRVTRVIRNPLSGLNGQSAHNDVALLELATPVTNVTPVPLATPAQAHLWDGRDGDQGMVTGWGLDASQNPASTKRYRNANILLPADDDAGIKMLRVDGGPCGGDSGSPLLVHVGATRVLAGVLKSAPTPCVFGMATYSEVGGDGQNRDFVLGTLTKLPYTSFGIADWDGDLHQDIIAREEATGDLWLYRGEGKRDMSSHFRTKIGNGWHGYTSFGVADWDRDGHQDIVARHDATGDLWLYRGESSTGYSGLGRVKIGSGRQGYTPFGVTDWNRDLHQDIVVREEATGDLLVYPGRSGLVPSTTPPVRISGGWQSRSPLGVADWDRDGYQDVVARANDNGDQLLFRGQSSGSGTLPPVKIGNGWQGFTPFDVADWDGDGHQDAVARHDATGDLWVYPGKSVTTVSPFFRAQIGRGW